MKWNLIEPFDVVKFILFHEGYCSNIMLASFCKTVLNFFIPAGPVSHVCDKEATTFATQRVQNLINERGSSLTEVFISIEDAKNKDDLKARSFGHSR